MFIGHYIDLISFAFINDKYFINDESFINHEYIINDQ